jgi:diadenosine tetraphosphate (Ap4A) HIT family hydrolase
MPGSSDEIYRRALEAADADGRLAMPPVEDWETFPFEGELRVRPLKPPVAKEKPRWGEGGVDCPRCKRGDETAIWRDEHWRLVPLEKPSGLPLVVILETRAHKLYEELSDDEGAELGRLQVRIERAVRGIDGIGRVHVCRWGDGSEHLHVWFMARPAGFWQLSGSFAAIWDDILPPIPEEVWRENLRVVAEALP